MNVYIWRSGEYIYAGSTWDEVEVRLRKGAFKANKVHPYDIKMPDEILYEEWIGYDNGEDEARTINTARFATKLNSNLFCINCNTRGSRMPTQSNPCSSYQGSEDIDLELACKIAGVQPIW